MHFRDLNWSPSEKKVARRAYDAALEAALASVMAEFKGKASAVTLPSEMWQIEDYLRGQRREIDEMFDYRYSQLPLSLLASFGRAIWMKISLPACRKTSARSFVRFWT